MSHTEVKDREQPWRQVLAGLRRSLHVSVAPSEPMRAPDFHRYLDVPLKTHADGGVGFRRQSL
jgi:hypothetical protein